MTETTEQLITVIVVAILVAIFLMMFTSVWEASKECEKKGGAYIRGNCVQVIK